MIKGKGVSPFAGVSGAAPLTTADRPMTRVSYGTNPKRHSITSPIFGPAAGGCAFIRRSVWHQTTFVPVSVVFRWAAESLLRIE